MSEVAKGKMRDLFKGYPAIFTAVHDRHDWVLLYASSNTKESGGIGAIAPQHFVCAFSPGERRVVILETNSLLTTVRNHHLFGFSYDDRVQIEANTYSFCSPHAGDELTIVLDAVRSPLAVFKETATGLVNMFSLSKPAPNRIQIDQKAELREFKRFLKAYFSPQAPQLPRLATRAYC